MMARSPLAALPSPSLPPLLYRYSRMVMLARTGQTQVSFLNNNRQRMRGREAETRGPTLQVWTLPG